MAAQPIVDHEKIRALKEKLTPSLYKGTAYDGKPNPEANSVDGKLYIQGVAPEKPAEPQPARQPLSAEERKLFDAGRAKREAAKAPTKAPNPAPAKVAAAKGVPAPAATLASRDVPRETPAATPAAEQDKPAFSYLEQVEAIEGELMMRGRTDEAAKVREEYNRLIDGQYRTLETEFKTKTLPQVQAIQAELLKFQGQQMPAELAMRARETVAQAGQQQQQMLAFLYGLARNDATRGMGIQYFNESDLIEPGVQLADLIVEGDMLIGVDAQGKPVNLSSGQPFQFPIAAAEQLYKQFYESDRADRMIVPEGAKVIDRATGRTVAHNPKDRSDSNETAASRLSYIKQGVTTLAARLGLTNYLDPTGKMIEGVDESTRQQWLEMSAKVEALILGGMPPQQAAEEVFRSTAGATPAAGPARGPAVDPRAAGYR